MAIEEDQKYGKDQIAECLQHQLGLNSSQSQKIVNIVFQSVILALLSGKRVYFPGIGVLCLNYIGWHKAWHPTKQIPIMAAPKIKTRLKSSKTLKRLLNKDVNLMKSRIGHGEDDDQ